MKKTTIIILLMLIHGCIYSQQTSNNKVDKNKTKPNPLVGTWRLVEFSDLDTITGNWKYQYGKNPNHKCQHSRTKLLYEKVVESSTVGVYSAYATRKRYRTYLA